MSYLWNPSGYKRGDVVWWLNRPCIVLGADIGIVVAHWGERRPGCVLLRGTEKRHVKYSDIEDSGYTKYDEGNGEF